MKRNTERDEDEDRDRRKAKRREDRRDARIGKVGKKDQADDGGEWETVRKGAATSDKPKMFAKVRFELFNLLLVEHIYSSFTFVDKQYYFVGQRH